MIRFLQASDFHLRRDRPERLEALRRVAESATREQAAALLIPGDLFDAPAEGDPLRAEVREVLESFAGTTLIVPGNHDQGAGGGAFPPGADYGVRTVVLAGDPCTEHRLETDAASVCVVGVPYHADRTLGRDLAGLEVEPLHTILLAHGTLQQEWVARMTAGEGDERSYYPIRREDLEGRFAYAALGHLHERAGFEGWTPQAAWGYAGTPVAISRKETGRRNAIAVEFEPGHGVRQVREVPLPTPYWERITETAVPWEAPGAALERLADKLDRLSRPADPRRGVRLGLDGWIDGDEAECRARLEALARRHSDAHRVVECEATAATVAQTVRARPWLGDLLERARRSAERSGADPRVLQRAVGFLIESAPESRG